MDRLLTDWAETIEPLDTPMFNYFQRFGWSVLMPPVIGHTPAKRTHRLWARLFRVGLTLQHRFARLVPATVTCDYEVIAGEYYERNTWLWVHTLLHKAADTEPKPIYDPNWKPPKPVTMEWGIHD